MNNKSEHIEVIYLGYTFDNDGSFTYNISLKQPAYKIVVKNTYFVNDKTGTDIYLLRSDLVKNKQLTIFSDGVSYSNYYTFTEQAPYVTGQYTFIVQSNLGVNTNITGQFSMIIEFHYS